MHINSPPSNLFLPKVADFVLSDSIGLLHDIIPPSGKIVLSGTRSVAEYCINRLFDSQQQHDITANILKNSTSIAPLISDLNLPLNISKTINVITDLDLNPSIFKKLQNDDSARPSQSIESQLSVADNSKEKWDSTSSHGITKAKIESNSSNTQDIALALFSLHHLTQEEVLQLLCSYRYMLKIDGTLIISLLHESSLAPLRLAKIAADLALKSGTQIESFPKYYSSHTIINLLQSLGYRHSAAMESQHIFPYPGFAQLVPLLHFWNFPSHPESNPNIFPQSHHHLLRYWATIDQHYTEQQQAHLLTFTVTTIISQA